MYISRTPAGTRQIGFEEWQRDFGMDVESKVEKPQGFAIDVASRRLILDT